MLHKADAANEITNCGKQEQNPRYPYLGFSIGSLYEYVASKEDILYLVCDSIHTEVERLVTDAMNRVVGERNVLTEILREYFLVCHRMSDVILLIYRETGSLPSQWRTRVLENELRITDLFVEVLTKLTAAGELPHYDDRDIELAAHNISVLGHMWTFRRWFFGKHYTIEDFIARQTAFILKILI